MKTVGEFVFIEIKHVDAGSFINDKGENISYNASWKLRVNEFTEYGIKERIFKVSENNQSLLKDLQSLHAYDKIVLEFDVKLFATSCKLEPVSLTF